MIQAIVLAILLAPTLASAQARPLPDMKEGIIARFAEVAAFDVTEAQDTLILTCTNCEQEVQIVVSVLTDVAGQAEQSPLERYLDERRARCFTLVAEREGRCVGTDPVSERGGALAGYSSLAEPATGREEREIVFQTGADLVIGRITYERRLALVRTLERTLTDTVLRLTPLY